MCKDICPVCDKRTDYFCVHMGMGCRTGEKICKPSCPKERFCEACGNRKGEYEGKRLCRECVKKAEDAYLNK